MNKSILSLAAILAFVAIASTVVPSTFASKDKEGDEIVVLSKSNLLILNQQVDGDSTSRVISEAKKLDSNLRSGRPMYLFLNTPGGSIQSGLELIEALKGIGRPVNTITLFAASMGFQIAQNLNDRLILRNGVLMSHHAAGEFAGAFGGVHPSQLDSRYQLWLDRVRELDEQTVARTKGKQTYDSYIKQYDKEMWLTGSKSVAQGYADKIILVKCDASLSGVTTNHVNFLGMDIAYDLDNCPINTSPMNIRIGGGNGVVSKDFAAEIRTKFEAQFKNKQSQVVPMFW